jgi:hypothetical protein
VRRAATAIWLVLAVAAVVYVEAAYGYGKPFHSAGEPSFLIRAGSDYAGPGLLPAGTYVNEGTGYDGQFSFYIAQDLLDRSAASEAHLDNPKYRFRRILLPLAGWVSSGGGPEVLQWTMPLINLLAALGSGFVLAAFLRRRGLSVWLALLYLLSLGLMVGVLNDLPDPLAASMFVMGLVWWAEDRTLLALAALGAAPFARELFILPLVGVALIELLRWRRAALVWLLPVVAYGCWNVYLEVAFRHAQARTEVTSPSPVPLVGAIQKIGNVLRTDVVGAANWELAFVLLALAVWGYLAVRSWGLLGRWRDIGGWPARAEFAPLIGLLAIFFIPFLTEGLWGSALSYVRYTAPAAAILLVVFAVQQDRWALRLAVALFALSLVNPLVALLPTGNGPLLTPV